MGSFFMGSVFIISLLSAAPRPGPPQATQLASWLQRNARGRRRARPDKARRA